MIGYYVHHHGRGHLHRAWSIQAQTRSPVTGLSTLPRPNGWRGSWIQLADDAPPPPLTSTEVRTAAGHLHYVPYHHPGLRARMATISGWIEAEQPSALVVDVSVEVAMLARLHGVPVLTVAQPGVRTDPPHRLGYGVSDTIIAPWPDHVPDLWQTSGEHAPVQHIGAISRFAPVTNDEGPVPHRVVVLNGAGGQSVAETAEAARAATPGWDWIILDRAAGTWVEDPWPLLRSAAVVVSHAGQNAVAEIAAARRPAVIIPQSRPFAEQDRLAAGLKRLSGRPAVVLPEWPAPWAWPGVLRMAAARSGSAWAAWNDGLGATRGAALLDRYDGVSRRLEVTRSDPVGTSA